MVHASRQRAGTEPRHSFEWMDDVTDSEETMRVLKRFADRGFRQITYIRFVAQSSRVAWRRRYPHAEAGFMTATTYPGGGERRRGGGREWWRGTQIIR